MRIAITGTTGRVGRALADHFSAAGHEVIELPRSVCDLAEPGCAAVLEDLDFEVLLNPAGLTSLEQCEDQPGLAQQVNATAPGELAKICRKRGKKLLHFSTDYVFDGVAPGLRREEDPPSPLSVYGRTKEQGERAVVAEGGTVMRVSWVFGPEKPAFPDQILAKALRGEELSAIADKFSLPAYTPDIAAWTEGLLKADMPGGIFHGCNSGPVTSWHGIALEITEFLHKRTGQPQAEVRKLSLAEMPAFRAVRPRHTAMATDKLETVLGKAPRDWREAVRQHLEACLLSR
ncbi:SDR family oxidoreductase [Luteolibacter luteus]|uniref:dTDP-4-dehydrorhamnose reductase n=1 Tax=Luteolibacter luteus TaxID=2728835 RepID=A0A858RIB1_9BACT|nr:NAD(P)-dependent oxidoreductase [Luteolibacter luteus]QJE96455.1 sugar nucleotide-binding protein [Luteolibacter luteus]